MPATSCSARRAASCSASAGATRSRGSPGTSPSGLFVRHGHPRRDRPALPGRVRRSGPLDPERGAGRRRCALGRRKGGEVHHAGRGQGRRRAEDGLQERPAAVGEDQAPRRHRGRRHVASPRAWASPTTRFERLGKAGVNFKLLDEAMAGASAVVRTRVRRLAQRRGDPPHRLRRCRQGLQDDPRRQGHEGLPLRRRLRRHAEGRARGEDGDRRPDARSSGSRSARTSCSEVREGWSKVEWHFFASSRSDSLGPTKALMDELRANGIGWVIHLP